VTALANSQLTTHDRLSGTHSVTGATTRKGRRLWLVSNWAWEPVTVPTPVAGVALLSGRGVREGGSVEPGAWDVDIVAEA
jgi:beta-galactosidase